MSRSGAASRGGGPVSTCGDDRSPIARRCSQYPDRRGRNDEALAGCVLVRRYGFCRCRDGRAGFSGHVDVYFGSTRPPATSEYRADVVVPKLVASAGAGRPLSLPASRDTGAARQLSRLRPPLTPPRDWCAPERGSRVRRQRRSCRSLAPLGVRSSMRLVCRFQQLAPHLGGAPLRSSERRPSTVASWSVGW